MGAPIQMNRRDLLRLLLASAIAESVDVEKLLWIPKSIITVPNNWLGIDWGYNDTNAGIWLEINRNQEVYNLIGNMIRSLEDAKSPR